MSFRRTFDAKSSRDSGVRCWATLSVFLLSCLLPARWVEAAAAEAKRGVTRMDRRALVIGNSSYFGDRLPNARNDAHDMEETLLGLNFKVDLLQDLNREEMENAIHAFGRQLSEDSVGLFYFAGHGTQVEERNYLIPVSDPSPTGEAHDDAIALSFVLETLAADNKGLRIFILDACRNQPEVDVGRPRGRNISARGFAIEAPAAGTLIAFATGPGMVAHDGPGRNGIFTGALLQELDRPGLNIEEILKNARAAVVENTKGSQVPWVLTSLIGEFIPRDTLAPSPSREERSEACLDLLGEPKAGDNGNSDFRLGRVMRGGKIMEPVLTWKTGDGDEVKYRNCLDGEPTDTVVSEADLEVYSSALVARFTGEKTVMLETFRETQGLGYIREGEAKLIFENTGSMLEARRQGNAHVAVIGTDSVGIIRQGITILLVTTRHAMIEMEPEVWDESWGDRPGDSSIGREIIWWELVGSNRLRIHPAVDSFKKLSDLLIEKPAEGSETGWSDLAEEDLAAILAKAGFSLILAEQVEHIELVEKLRRLAEKVNSAGFDVAKLEPMKKDLWRDEDFLRLEEAADWGRYWLLSRVYELVAIMPSRIAGKIRLAHRKSVYRKSVRRSSSGSETARIQKDDLTLATDSSAMQVVNAIYQDQTVGMAKTMSFLGCLLRVSDEASDRIEVLHQGLERIHFPAADLRKEMDVREAFHDLFQGLNLPLALPAGERLFLGGIRRQDPEVLHLVQSLEGYLETTLVESEGLCDVALIPDTVLLGQSVEPPRWVASMPKPFLDDTVTPTSGRYADALMAKSKVREILEDAIHVKGAKHTRRKMERGHLAFAKGNQLLRGSHGEGEEIEPLLDEAILAFEKAEEIFAKARETAFRKEHSKPKVRVH